MSSQEPYIPYVIRCESEEKPGVVPFRQGAAACVAYSTAAEYFDDFLDTLCDYRAINKAFL